jgi:DNA-binding CsgD family transcriptional regulator
MMRPFNTAEGRTEVGGSPRRRTGPLSKREREVFGLLADGLSGAEIAERLVLSPETVRTHIRNAMAKLGASTRSQAVALALQRQEIAVDEESADQTRPAPSAGRPDGTVVPAGPNLEPALQALIEGLASLWDVDGGWIFIAEEDGLTLRRAAHVSADERPEPPAELALGEGPLGGAALERRPQVVHAPAGEGGAMIAAPMLDSGRLIGVIGLATRSSRPTGRQELLLLQALAGRMAEVIHGGGPQAGAGLDQALRRFRASWSASTRPG